MADRLSELFDRPQPKVVAVKTPLFFRGLPYFRCSGGIKEGDGEPKHFEFTDPFTGELVQELGELEIQKQIQIRVFGLPALQFPAGALSLSGLMNEFKTNETMDSIFVGSDEPGQYSFSPIPLAIQRKLKAVAGEATKVYIDTWTSLVI